MTAAMSMYLVPLLRNTFLTGERRLRSSFLEFRVYDPKEISIIPSSPTLVGNSLFSIVDTRTTTIMVNAESGTTSETSSYLSDLITRTVATISRIIWIIDTDQKVELS